MTGSSCPYTQGLNTVQYNTDLCVAAFGISAATNAARVAFSNDVWGGVGIQGSRILFPNGEIDPWHYLGVLTSPNAEEPVSRTHVVQ